MFDFDLGLEIVPSMEGCGFLEITYSVIYNSRLYTELRKWPIHIECVIKTHEFLDPWVRMSNKFFLGAALTQMGIVCWYADDIYRASVGVSDAVFESGWFRTDVRSRRALLVMLQRSQKPLYFSALKFSTITMATFSSILTSSYSYFTLLYSSFKQHGNDS